jgi:cyclophilin family peptidyl-prolyl cis-trans isomerase
LGIFGGDVIRDDGTSGESIYGMVFRDENYTIMHDQRYLLSATKPHNTPHTTNSQFMITLAPLPWLDYKYQVFGRVRSTSRALVDYIEFFGGTSDWDRKETPFFNIKIKNCYLT